MYSVCVYFKRIERNVLIIVVSGIIFGVYTLYNRFGSKDKDPRGFGKVKEGTYGTASMMTEMR